MTDSVAQNSPAPANTNATTPATDAATGTPETLSPTAQAVLEVVKSHAKDIDTGKTNGEITWRELSTWAKGQTDQVPENLRALLTGDKPQGFSWQSIAKGSWMNAEGGLASGQHTGKEGGNTYYTFNVASAAAAATNPSTDSTNPAPTNTNTTPPTDNTTNPSTTPTDTTTPPTSNTTPPSTDTPTGPTVPVGTKLAMTPISFNQTDNPGQAVSSILGDTLKSASGKPLYLAVVGSDNKNGTWEYSGDNGKTWTAISNPSMENFVSLAPTDLVRFKPTNADSAEPSLTFYTWDSDLKQMSATTGLITVSVNGNTAPQL